MELTLGWLIAAAVLLSLERACYVWIARAPGSFRRWCTRPAVARLGEPVAVVAVMFIGFKLVQVAVFAGWWAAHGHGELRPADGGTAVLAVGSAAMLAGQFLNGLVFYRLGRIAVFFGDRLGYDVGWCQDFPFSVMRHPQYVGTVLTIWGFFLAARCPGDDWYLLPALETVYYVLGAALESAEREAAVTAARPATASSSAHR